MKRLMKKTKRHKETNAKICAYATKKNIWDSKKKKHHVTTSCYDLSLRQGRFAGNVCQGLRLAVWANVPWNVGNVQLIRNVGNVPDVSDVLNVHLIYICRYLADRQFLSLAVNTFIY